MKSITLCAALGVSLMLPAAARAQGGGKPPRAEEVIVTQSASGEQLRGRIVELSPTTLALLVNGQRVEVPLDRVLRIEGQNDSVKDGAAYGAAIAGGLVGLACAQGLEARYCVTAGLVYAGIGALAGAGVDALHKGRTTIYSKPAPVSVAIAPTRKGARLQFKVTF